MQSVMCGAELAYGLIDSEPDRLGPTTPSRTAPYAPTPPPHATPLRAPYPSTHALHHVRYSYGVRRTTSLRGRGTHTAYRATTFFSFSFCNVRYPHSVACREPAHVRGTRLA
eukprot:519581-Rhodomonas_salina.2